jgi:hypothetical protein
MRFIYDLLPLLSKSASGRVVSVLAAGLEDKIDTTDLDLKDHYSLPATANHGATMNSLAFEELAKENPTISFVHAYPGLVDTNLIGNLLGNASGWQALLTTIAKYTVLPILRLFTITPDEAGERGLYEATSSTFAVGAEGSEVNGFFRIDGSQDRAKKVDILETYKAEGVPKKVWEHTMSIYETVLA